MIDLISGFEIFSKPCCKKLCCHSCFVPHIEQKQSRFNIILESQDFWNEWSMTTVFNCDKKFISRLVKMGSKLFGSKIQCWDKVIYIPNSKRGKLKAKGVTSPQAISKPNQSVFHQISRLGNNPLRLEILPFGPMTIASAQIYSCTCESGLQNQGSLLGVILHSFYSFFLLDQLVNISQMFTGNIYHFSW